MKKFLALLLALAMTLSLVACGGNNNAANDGDDANANTDGDKVYKVAMICDSSISDGGWGAACYNAMVLRLRRWAGRPSTPIPSLRISTMIPSWLTARWAVT